jgi:ATP-dependent Lon protease
LPEIYKSVNLSVNDIYFNDESILYIIDNYTFEAGVRKLKEKLYELIRELNLKIINYEYLEKINININLIDNILGENNKLDLQKINDVPQVGRVCGMYASSYGSGGITIIESSKSLSEQRLNLELTGNQGDVMKESMRVAKTLAWSLISDDIKKKIRLADPYGIHIHCPEAAVSKDGPSAGTAITVCIISLLANIPIRNNISITGEIDLNGNVLAIGGLESKLEGAKNAGINLALYPEKNEKDLKRIIEENKLLLDDTFSVKSVSKISEVINIIFDHTCMKPSFIENK